MDPSYNASTAAAELLGRAATTNPIKPLISSWTANPIAHFTLSASGLLALADLRTVATRTALTGGSTWLDALVLAPGLHYQQAAESLDRDLDPQLASLSAVERIKARTPSDRDSETHYGVKNVALARYLKKVSKASKDNCVTLDVCKKEDDRATRRLGSMVMNRKRPQRRVLDGRPLPGFDWFSHVLYLASPLLTLAVLILIILMRDWWAFAFVLALMVSRILNILIIKRRCRPENHDSALQGGGGGTGITSSSSPAAMSAKAQELESLHSLDKELVDDSTAQRLTEYNFDLGEGQSVLLRGLASDLEALTTQVWMRAKDHLDEYLEASAKLIVHLVASLSGNVSQAGGFLLMALLLVSAGLLGLSNGHAKSFRMHGCVVRAPTHSYR